MKYTIIFIYETNNLPIAVFFLHSKPYLKTMNINRFFIFELLSEYNKICRILLKKIIFNAIVYFSEYVGNYPCNKKYIKCTKDLLLGSGWDERL